MWRWALIVWQLEIVSVFSLLKFLLEFGKFWKQLLCTKTRKAASATFKVDDGMVVVRLTGAMCEF